MTKYSALPAVVTPAGTDEWGVNQGGVSKKLTLAQIKTFLAAGNGLSRVSRLNSTHSISSTTGTEVTDLSQTLEVGTYVFDYYLILRSATASVSPMLGVNFSGTAATKTMIAFWADLTTAITAETHGMDDEGVNTFGYIVGRATKTYTTTAPNIGTTVATAVSAVATNIPFRITGLLLVTAAGDLELWHSSETATATSIEVGSSLVVTRTA
jgi:hypothetical protein